MRDHGACTVEHLTPPRHQRQQHRRTVRSGHRVLIRPIHRDDKQRLLDAFERLSPESRYRRFFSPVPHLRAGQLRYLTELDHHTHEAVAAIDPRTDQGIGVARFVRSADDPDVAEFAIAVVDHWQGRGIGTALLEELVGRARAEGVKRFSASVLAGNNAMLELLHKLGDVHTVGREQGVVELVIDLSEGAMPEPLRHTVREAARGDIHVDPRHPAAEG